jgi:hypothetical protein
MRKHTIRGYFIAAIGLFLFASFAKCEAEQIKSEQQPRAQVQTNEPNKAEQKSPSPEIPVSKSVLGEGRNGEGNATKDDREEQGTEFWPPFSGYRLKITDTFVAAFTAFLFFATVALYCATRRLVIGAENTAERQLRAYIHVDESTLITEISSKGIDLRVRTEIKNWGQTPAYDIRNASYLAKLPFPMPNDYSVASPTLDAIAGGCIGPGQCFYNDAVLKEAFSHPQHGERYYAVGIIQYFDTFRGKLRTTKYCVSMDIGAFLAEHVTAKIKVNETGGSSPTEGQVKFQIAPYHNEAD